MARLDLGVVVKRHAAGFEFLQMAVEGVLVQGDEHIDLNAMGTRLLGRHSHAQPGVAPANHRLVAVVGERWESLGGERQDQRVTGRRNTISRCAPDTDNDLGLAGHCSWSNQSKKAILYKGLVAG